MMQIIAWLIAGIIGFFSVVWGGMLLIDYVHNKIFEGLEMSDYDDL
jgi:hypothetical protein